MTASKLSRKESSKYQGLYSPKAGGMGNLPESQRHTQQQLSGPVTNRTWTVLTTGALLVLGGDGLMALLTTGAVEWAGLVALVVGTVNLVDLVRRWTEI
jgi:hypothetical protein